MSSYTYPPPAPTISGDDVTVDHVHKFLGSPALVSRRLRTLLDQRYISDRLLTGRFVAVGGAIQYETGESVFTEDDPEAVAPGGEYPLTTAGTGTASIAKTVKWGQDSPVTDESINRLRLSAADRAMTKLVNQSVNFVDSVTMSAITSAVTAGTAGSDWSAAGTVAEDILSDVGLAKANIINLKQGYMPDLVVVDDINWMHAMIKFAAAGLVPRETPSQNPIVSGSFPTVLGMAWLPTPNAISGTALVADSEQLGGMADEDLGGPGYTRIGGIGVETKSIRDDDNDQWKLRARRVTVPVILEPAAARKVTGI